MSFSEKLSVLIGRIGFGWFFFAQVFNYLGDWTNTYHTMEEAGVPAAAFLLTVALLVLVMGAASLILGYHARYGALSLFVVTAIAAVTMHAYWHFPEGTDVYAHNRELFICYAAISGGLLMLVGLGPGPYSIDNRGKGGPKK